MLDALITSKTRLKLLLKFFINPTNTSYLRGLATEFSESTNSVRVELNRLEKADMLMSFVEGNKKLFKANTKHPLYTDIQTIVLKYVGIDAIIEKVLNNLGEVQQVFLVGDLANGTNNKTIELLIVGEVNEEYLQSTIHKVENTIKRSICYTIESIPLFNEHSLPVPSLKIWEDTNAN
ncbi:ArsR family transcriptional regulator [Flammeovirga pectinis]|uniref:ArsR family transcriptional regulator n=1 Tax=Flammeovirga pectinis TaxID=2494373 RepID=A0A3Q9FMD1_9BACT|nr:ArsR family transcriptional regulator [Flammeovirga pectinis]AZQ61560.1 ArsR family transcriptional regulator [Flammeovirga pectinis]